MTKFLSYASFPGFKKITVCSEASEIPDCSCWEHVLVGFFLKELLNPKFLNAHLRPLTNLIDPGKTKLVLPFEVDRIVVQKDVVPPFFWPSLRSTTPQQHFVDLLFRRLIEMGYSFHDTTPNNQGRLIPSLLFFWNHFLNKIIISVIYWF